MSLKEKIKQNFLIFFITILFMIWITFLIITGIISSREVFFYDVLNDIDVTDQYTSQIPIFRYLIEPILGFISIVTFNNNPQDSLPFFLITAITFRVIIMIFDRTVWKNSEKRDLIYIFIKDILRFILKYGSLIIIISGLIILIGYFLAGFI